MKDGNAYAFPFHYGQEAESYTFYQVPKILFTAEAFDHLSTDAKLLYGILLALFEAGIMGVTIGTGIIESLVDAALMGIAGI